MRPVVVWWVDAHADAYGWTDRGELDLEPHLIRSCGFDLGPVKPDHVSIAQSVTGECVDQVTHIPTVNVRRVKELR